MKKNGFIKFFEKAALILILIICAGIFIYGNLYKGVAGTDESPFSLNNFIKIVLIFLIGVPAIIGLKKIFKNKNKKGS